MDRASWRALSVLAQWSCLDSVAGNHATGTIRLPGGNERRPAVLCISQYSENLCDAAIGWRLQWPSIGTLM